MMGCASTHRGGKKQPLQVTWSNKVLRVYKKKEKSQLPESKGGERSETLLSYGDIDGLRLSFSKEAS